MGNYKNQMVRWCHRAGAKQLYTPRAGIPENAAYRQEDALQGKVLAQHSVGMLLAMQQAL